MAGFFSRLFGKKQDPVSDRDDFALRLVEAVRQQAPEIDLHYDAGNFELQHVDPDANGQRMFLANSFIEYSRLTGGEQQEHFGKVVQFIIASRKPAPSGEEALNSLLPVLRSRADIMAVACDRNGFHYSQSSRPFCETMLLMLAIDSDISIGLVTDDMLEQLGISFDEALGVAIGHLDERGNHSWGQLAEGTFVSNCGDYYDASRILLPGLVEQLPVKGNPVAIVQARSAVLLTGSEDREGLEMIAGYALQDFPENERAVSLTPIEFHDGQWRALELCADHPQSLKNLRAQQTAWAYEATQQVLQERLGDDIFVATAQLFENEGRFATLATWTDGVDTLCPLADGVWIQNQDGSDGMLRSMEDVVDVCGPFEPAREMDYPLRWRLPAWISAEQRARLRNDYPDLKLFGD